MPSSIKGKKIELQILKLGRLTGWFVRSQKREIKIVDCRGDWRGCNQEQMVSF